METENVARCKSMAHPALPEQVAEFGSRESRAIQAVKQDHLPSSGDTATSQIDDSRFAGVEKENVARRKKTAIVAP